MESILSVDISDIHKIRVLATIPAIQRHPQVGHPLDSGWT
jgi:hypothetical protein